MKSNELRIGNMVMISEVKCKVIGIEGCKNIKNGFSVFDTVRLSGDGINSQQQIYCQGVSPIALTEEILLKCGFIKYSHEPGFGLDGEKTEKCDQYSLLKLCIMDWGYGFVLSNSFSFDLRVELKSLHQLQNLFYALTQTELEIKL